MHFSQTMPTLFCSVSSRLKSSKKTGLKIHPSPHKLVLNLKFYLITIIHFWILFIFIEQYLMGKDWRAFLEIFFWEDAQLRRELSFSFFSLLDFINTQQIKFKQGIYFHLVGDYLLKHSEGIQVLNVHSLYSSK